MRPNLGPHYLKGLAVASLSEYLEKDRGIFVFNFICYAFVKAYLCIFYCNTSNLAAYFEFNSFNKYS